MLRDLSPFGSLQVVVHQSQPLPISKFVENISLSGPQPLLLLLSVGAFSNVASAICAPPPKVIVMESTWKSGNEREALQYLRPNPFFVGIVRMLLEAQKVGLGAITGVCEGLSGDPALKCGCAGWPAHKDTSYFPLLSICVVGKAVGYTEMPLFFFFREWPNERCLGWPLSQ